MSVVPTSVDEAIGSSSFANSIASNNDKQISRLHFNSQAAVNRETTHLGDHPRTEPSVLHERQSRDVRILLADADSTLAARNEFYLSQLGYDVVIATDGLACVSSLRKHLPHVLVLDAGLLWGRAEGVLALKESDADFADIPVLVTYDEAHRPRLSALQQFNICDLAAKPLAPPKLAEHIFELIPFHVQRRIT